jgi:hypothetical protein
MGMFFTGIFTTVMVGSWIYSLNHLDTEGIVITTIFLLVIAMGLGAYLEDKYGKK